MMVKIEQDFEFEYEAERSKREFQVNINNLLELQGTLIAKLAEATLKKKEGVFLGIGEMEIISDLLLNTCSNLIEHHGELDRVNRKSMKLYLAGQKIREHSKVIHLKDVAHVAR